MLTANKRDTGIDERFKCAMRRLASTVTIITTEWDGRRYGMIATAVCSLGVNPPSLLVSVAQSASLHDPVLASKHFCVNLLRVLHADLLPPFSGQHTGESRFEFGCWARHEVGLPFLSNAQASLFCKVDDVLRYGDHAIVVGRVIDARVAEEIEPLLYQNGSIAAAQSIS
jgi:flavin reductase (DIM6/NTAB) family NADH-FMN oxidoreductase RutF